MAEAGYADKNPETFQHAQLLTKDFDGTVARTFEKSPNGLSVHETYALTIDEMFGHQALKVYMNNGGLNNRAPIEVLRSLAPDANDDELVQLTTDFTARRLAIFLGEIGSRFPDGSIWPRPTPGYLELREQIEIARVDGRLIDDAIISSGHKPFIAKTYAAWSVGEPTHVVAEDTARQLRADVPPAQLVKPSPILMDIAISMWRRGYEIDPTSGFLPDERSRIVYIGDDPVKDGALAKNSGVDFVLLDPDHSTEAWENIAARLQLEYTSQRSNKYA